MQWRKQATFLRYDNYETDTHLVRVILVLAHWQNNPRVGLSLHSYPLSCFRPTNILSYSLALRALRRSSKYQFLVRRLTRNPTLTITSRMLLKSIVYHKPFIYIYKFLTCKQQRGFLIDISLFIFLIYCIFLYSLIEQWTLSQ